MSTQATILALKSRAKLLSDHAFNLAGNLAQARGELGAEVKACDLQPLFDRLCVYQSREDGAPDLTQSAVLLDSTKLAAELTPQALAILRHDGLAAELDEAILRRENEYLLRCKHLTEFKQLLTAFYQGKKESLGTLKDLSHRHFLALERARGGALPGDGSGDDTDRIEPTSRAKTHIRGLATVLNQVVATTVGKAEEVVQRQTIENSIAATATYTGKQDKYEPTNWTPIFGPDPTTLAQETLTSDISEDYRFPRLENSLRYERLSLDLREENLERDMAELQMQDLETAWSNELRALDLQIRGLQITFIETFLLPRIGGVITGVFKMAGENVRLGDAVVRIESDETLQLVGQVRCTSRLRLGAGFTLRTANVFESDPPVELVLKGKIVSVRGFDAESKKWNLVLECTNAPADSSARLPIGYEFEWNRDYTSLVFD